MPLQSHTPRLLMASATTTTTMVPLSVLAVMLVPTALTISAMTFVPLFVLLSLMLIVLPTTAVFFHVH